MATPNLFDRKFSRKNNGRLFTDAIKLKKNDLCLSKISPFLHVFWNGSHPLWFVDSMPGHSHGEFINENLKKKIFIRIQLYFYFHNIFHFIKSFQK